MLPLLVAALTFPLLSFVLLILGGRSWGGHGRTVGTLAAAASAVCSLAALAGLLFAGAETSSPPVGSAPWAWDWITFSDGVVLQIGARADALTAALSAVVGVVSTCVHVFSWGYMAGDARPDRYFAALSLFGFAMLGLLISDNLLMVLLFWEGVGFASYLLIGHWYERPAAADAATKAFVVNRVGDAGMIIGIALLLAAVRPPADGAGAVSPLNLAYLLNHPDLLAVAHPAAAGHPIPSPPAPLPRGGEGSHASAPPAAAIDYTLLTLAGVCLFLGAVGKSAQFPLHIWLADAMEGPTPVSALIHAATMVAAGVYLTARIFPILTPAALLFVAYTGAVTLMLGALLALVQSDIKRVLAYSTISQLGYMVLAVGLGAPAAALLHLFTHAFFKALLFLGAGSVRHATGHRSDIFRLGGLRRKLPVTAAAFLIGCLSLAGLPPLLMSGFFSKEAVLAAALDFAVGTGHWVLLLLPVTAAGLTAFYLARVYLAVFEGRPHDQTVSAADESGHGRVMLVPLMVLAALSFAPVCLAAGLLDQRALHPAFLTATDPATGLTGGQTSLITALGGTPVSPGAVGHAALPVAVTTVSLSGLAVAGLFYGLRVFSHGEIRRRFSPIHGLLSAGFHLDAAAGRAASAAVAVGRGLDWFDRVVIDGLLHLTARGARGLGTMCARHDAVMLDALVNHTARVFYTAGEGLRHVQAGGLRNYVQLLVGGSVAAGVAAAAVLLPETQAARAATGTFLAGVGLAVVIRRSLMPVQIGPTTATFVTAALGLGILLEPGGARSAGAAMLSGLCLMRLLSWVARSPSSERFSGVPGTAVLTALGLYFDPAMFAVGTTAGAALEGSFVFLHRRAAVTILLALSLVAAALLPENPMTRAALAGLSGGLLTGHIGAWTLKAIQHGPAELLR
jgi:NADH:ubiquinone oxidoreductase subunit 5 (subunit L)/multisubunit Na+/H+ antiporter MnhA subunit